MVSDLYAVVECLLHSKRPQQGESALGLLSAVVLSVQSSLLFRYLYGCVITIISLEKTAWCYICAKVFTEKHSLYPKPSLLAHLIILL